MAFAGNFTSVQQAPNSNSNLLFTDTSVGTDTNITDRQIRPYDATGTLVLPAGNTLGYIDWPIPLATPLTVNLLPKDMALVITVNWISSAPIGGSTYVATILYGFTGYSDAFMYQLIENLSANPALRNDANWSYYYSRGQDDIDSVLRAITNNSILNAQENLDDMKYIIDNNAKFF
jgi:hypothetical protein